MTYIMKPVGYIIQEKLIDHTFEVYNSCTVQMIDYKYRNFFFRNFSLNILVNMINENTKI